MKTGMLLLTGICFVSMVGCASSSGSGSSFAIKREQIINELEKDPVPGTVTDVWVEPMVDCIRVPGQLDVKGVYYRKAHKECVEIRPGRFQLVEYPEQLKNDQNPGRN